MARVVITFEDAVNEIKISVESDPPLLTVSQRTDSDPEHTPAQQIGAQIFDAILGSNIVDNNSGE